MALLALDGTVLALLALAEAFLRARQPAPPFVLGDAWLFVAWALVAPAAWQTAGRSPRRPLRFLAFAAATSLSGALAGGLATGSAALLAFYGHRPDLTVKGLLLASAALHEAAWCGLLWWRARHVVHTAARQTTPGATLGWTGAAATLLALA